MEPNTATIISGVLSLVGGAAGALGAYFVATRQMKKQFEYEKRKEEKQNTHRILQTLKKLELLNKDTIGFAEHFEKEFTNPHIDELDYKLKVREYDLHYIVNKVEKINDDILLNEYSIDYLKFSRALNNLYIEIIGFVHMSEEHKYAILGKLVESVVKRKADFDSFDVYVNEQIKEIQLELEKNK